MNGTPESTSPRKFYTLLTIVVLVGSLYFGREVFLPLVLAILISFLLAPLINRLECWKLNRAFSVIVTTFFTMGVIGIIGYILAGQVLDLANELPKYQTNLRAKIESLKTSENSPISKATKTLRELAVEVSNPAAARPAAPKAPDVPVQTAVPVKVVESTASPLELAESYIGTLLGYLASAAIVALFVIFILLEREDLRDRIIHLVGKHRLHLTTQALDDAAQRVSRYLRAQLIVNATYAILIGTGLYFIGIPNAILWGILAGLFRFIPYLGPFLGAACPLSLSLAVAPSWTAPSLTTGLFVGVELVCANVVEPWLYGAETGLSPMAVIVAAVFWGWLWGIPGLLLATPLTVCLAVLGKHIPGLVYLDILLGDKPPIALGDRLYQRLLALDEEESLELVEKHIAEVSLASAYDDVILPAIRLLEQERRDGSLSADSRQEMYTLVRRLLTDIDETPPPPDDVAVPVLCLPASNAADEVAAIMLAHLLGKRGVMARVLSSKSLVSEMIEVSAKSGAPILCISAVPPGSVMPATHLCKRLRGRLPEARIVVGLWREADVERRQQRLKRVNADDIFVKLDAAANEIAMVAGLGGKASSAPVVSA